MDTSTQTVLMELLGPEMCARVSDWFSDTSSNQTLIHREISSTDNQLYYRKEALSPLDLTNVTVQVPFLYIAWFLRYSCCFFSAFIGA